MSSHRLDPLLKPASIALVGVSDRIASPGQVLADMVLNADYEAAVYLVNPRYSEIRGQRCFDRLESLPQTVEQVVLALGNAHLESALSACIEHGAKAVTIYSSGILPTDSEPPLIERLAAMARRAGIQICGLNGMGFYNLSQDLYVGIFPRSLEIVKGGISYIAQSGSAFTTLCHNGCRLGFNLCVSAGNEIATGVADYMDWSLEQADTRVIGLFLETVREPAAFVNALAKANARNIPVVVLKIGKSPLAAAMALTHTGAIAGNHAVFQALFKRYGVIEVNDFDEMASILMLLQSGREAGDGGLAAIFESGGFRELVTDEAHQLGLEFAPLEDSTVSALESHLDPGLKAENPLDAWGSHDRYEQRFEACMDLLMQDPNVAAGVFVSNLRDGYFLSEAIYRVIEKVSRQCGKPIALATCYSDLANTEICRRAHAAGIPLIDGARETLLACQHLFEYRRFKQSSVRQSMTTSLDADLVVKWKQRLQQRSATKLDETEALALLADFSIPVVAHETVSEQSELLSAAARIGFPLVLKTAAGIGHKSEQNGVIVDIRDQADLLLHYRDLESRLGPQVVVAKMIGDGVEIGLGILNDKQFGPIVMVAAGGILVELLGDRAVAMCPVNAAQAEDLLGSLKINRLLLGVRGKPACNRQVLIDAIVGLSVFAFEFRDCISEIDINPILVDTDRACAVDALIVIEKT